MSHRPHLELSMTTMVETSDTSTWAPKMLIADDDPSVVRLLAERCAHAGFEVETATNGIQALLRANRSHPDILVIDISMPKADGFAVCRQLLDPTKNSFDVVVITGSEDQETIERCESMGAFYAHKGPDFWDNFASALTEIFPSMADKISSLKKRAPGKVRKRPRVLVVDDDVYMQLFFADKFEKFGVELLYAPDVAGGIE